MMRSKVRLSFQNVVFSELLLFATLLIDNHSLNQYSIIATFLEGITFGTVITILMIKVEKLKNKNVNINSFVQMVVHDIKNSTAGIMDLSSFLLEHSTNLNIKQIEDIDLIKKTSKSLVDSTTDMLEISKIESGVYQLNILSQNIFDVITEVLDIFLIVAEMKNITIMNHIEENTAHALFDSAALNDVLSNLISNAIKYSPAHTKISLSIKEISNEYLRISIADQGLGISEKDMQSVFQEFQKLSARPTGDESSSGLGLSIVKRLIEQMGGEVGVDSKGKRQGATFWFTLKRGNNENRI